MAININGLEVVVDRLEKLASREKAEGAVKEATLFVVAEVRKNAQQIAKSGELAKSIDFRRDGLSGIVFTPLQYAPYVEYGTGLFATGKGGGRKEVPWVYVEGQEGESGRAKTIHTKQSAIEAVEFLREKGLKAYMTYGQHPQPYMRPALDDNKDTIIQILGEALIND